MIRVYPKDKAKLDKWIKKSHPKSSHPRIISELVALKEQHEKESKA